MKPRLLDLFCGAGGAAVGYHRAGFDVIGVDIEPQPHFPFEFHQGDAMTWPLAGFDAIHASPPCQAYVALAGPGHPRLIEPVRERLEGSGVPWVIENVEGAPLRNAARVCGSAFGLGVRRHRQFESSVLLMSTPCVHGPPGTIRAYYGKPGWVAYAPTDNVQSKGRTPLYRGTVALAPVDMGIDWMTWDELREAIPPAYTEHIGSYLILAIKDAA